MFEVNKSAIIIVIKNEVTIIILLLKNLEYNAPNNPKTQRTNIKYQYDLAEAISK